MKISEGREDEDLKPANPAQADERTITGGACIDTVMKNHLIHQYRKGLNNLLVFSNHDTEKTLEWNLQLC